MSEEKIEPPEIVHGTDRDDGALIKPRAITCSKRLHDQDGRVAWCTRPERHAGDCDGVFAAPANPNAPIVIDHRYGRPPK